MPIVTERQRTRLQVGQAGAFGYVLLLAAGCFLGYASTATHVIRIGRVAIVGPGFGSRHDGVMDHMRKCRLGPFLLIDTESGIP